MPATTTTTNKNTNNNNHHPTTSPQQHDDDDGRRRLWRDLRDMCVAVILLGVPVLLIDTHMRATREAAHAAAYRHRLALQEIGRAHV